MHLHSPHSYPEVLTLIRHLLAIKLEGDRKINSFCGYTQKSYRVFTARTSNTWHFMPYANTVLSPVTHLHKQVTGSGNSASLGLQFVPYLDFSKAFDTVPHRRLINKLQSLSLDSNIVEWIRQWLSDRQQRVVVNGVYSAQGLVTSGVPQGSVLGPILFNIFISDIAEGINGKVCLFAEDTKICNRVDVPGGISQMTNDLGKLKKWSELWQLSFNVDKCKIMHLGRKNPRAEYRIFDTVLTSTSEERDLGVIISEDLRVSSQCNRAAGNAGRMLGCVGRGISSRKREVLMPLYRALVRPHLEYCVQYRRPYLQKDIDILERVQRRATKMVYGLKGEKLPGKA
uniref:Reverse transcriptase domain-containing protein n=1 Tax=Leptobrachium leishanense TaxID=445787 RepID=A0A8C5R0U2_9ANUR